MKKKYDIIYADPPWKYEFSAKAGSAIEKHYPTMELDDIIKLPINEIASNDCYLFLWSTMPKLEESFDVIKGWKFRYRTVAFVWVKTKKINHVNQASFFPYDSFEEIYGNGIYTRQNCELVLLARNGRGLVKLNDTTIKQLIYEPRQRHSKKPDSVAENIIKLLGDKSRIELFARNKREGWDVFGNEVESDIQLIGEKVL